MSTTAVEGTDGLMSVRDAARKLDLSEHYVRYLTDTGRLTCTRDRLGSRRFKQSDLRNFQRRRRRRAHPNSTLERRA
jgi:excisionase family DNA binding protein